MNCQSCGLINRPFEEFCGHCRRELLDEAAAGAKRREWDALSPALRAEQEKHYADFRARFDEHQRWLRRHRLLHTIAGGMLVSLAMNAAAFFVTFWTIPIDFAIGGAAGFLLNRAGGGAYRGLALFLVGGTATVAALMPFINSEGFWKGAWLFSSFALMFVAGAGYILGLLLDVDHVEHQLL